MRPRNILQFGVFAMILATAGLVQSQSARTVPVRERLTGAWHLVRIEDPDSPRKTAPAPQGVLIYTRDGHMSVQLMYSTSDLSNEYVHDGYEASFGTYDVNEATRMLTHHVQGSVTRELLAGKDLARVYQFTKDGHLILRSVRPEEHWSVTWEHY